MADEIIHCRADDAVGEVDNGISRRAGTSAIPEGWSTFTLGQIVQSGRKICYGIVQPGENTASGIPLIRGRDYSFGWAPLDGFYRVSEEIDRPYKRSKVKPNDLLLTIVGAGTGNVAVVPEWLDGANITQTTARISVDHARHDYRFVKALLESDYGKQAVYRAIKGGAQPGLNIGDVELFEFMFPPRQEEQRIADVLATWDSAIENVEALIANTGAQKQALIQQLLPRGPTPPKKRLPGFAGEWRKLHIGDVAKEISERAGEKADFPVLSCSKYDGLVESLTYFKKKVYSDDTSNYKVMRRGTFGFPSNHIEEGSIGYQDKFDAGIVSPIYCVFTSNAQVDDGFLYKLLKTDHYRQIFAAATNASVDRRGSLRWKEFSRIVLLTPPLDEQKAINEAVNSVVAIEAAYETQLTALRQEKAALLQQLLTGKRRITLLEQEAAYA